MPFECEPCRSAFMYWIRPYPTGKKSIIRDFDEFLYDTELALELDYDVESWKEVLDSK